MNRLVLIGNGFDLAHGLKTSYADFITWYWDDIGAQLSQERTNTFEDQLCSFKLNPNCDTGVWYLIKRQCFSINIPNHELANTAKNNPELCFFHFKSPLFKQICDKLKNNWVDIEAEFYDMLKKEESIDRAKQLNDDLDFIKKKLIEYLKQLPEFNFNQDFQKIISQPISKKDIAIGFQNKWNDFIKRRHDNALSSIEYNKEYSPDELDYIIKNYYDYISRYYYTEESPYDIRRDIKQKLEGENNYDKNISKDGEFIHSFLEILALPSNIMLLNFNYTLVGDNYLPRGDSFSINHIHGTIDNWNDVIFGYGDERDDNFKKIRNKDEYLRNIKTYKYLENDNYRNVLAFIESDPYQIYIMGHSCGASDRTLLTTLFEHKNCVSIKPFYHRKDDDTDNFANIIQAMSRNFTDMEQMRNLVVNKKYCEELPQNATQEDSLSND